MVQLDPSSMPSYGLHGAHLASTTAASAGAGPLACCLLRTPHGILPWFSPRQNRHCRHHPREQGDAGGSRESPVEWPVLFTCHSNPEKPPYACQTATSHLS